MATPTPLPTVLAIQPEFLLSLGTFHAMWSSMEVTTDYAIGQFLKLSYGETHLITSGMMFGRKARLLADLIGKSEHPKKAALLGAFNQIRGDNKRDVIVHGYIVSKRDTVTFIERMVGGSFTAKEHTFTLEEFVTHAQKVSQQGAAFYDALGIHNEELMAFAEAALSLNRKPSTHSPEA